MPSDALPADALAIPVVSRQATDTTMMSDMQKMLELGLSLTDIERMWTNVPGIDMAKVHEVGDKLLSRNKVPLARQASVGLELLRRQTSPDSSEHARAEDQLVGLLEQELADPPEHLRDPVMLTLMKDPLVLSSGHVFDRTTIYDRHGRLRFESCPMTRARLKPDAFPVVGLKRQLVEYRLRKLDQILEVLDADASHAARHAARLLAMASTLLDGLEGTYHDRTTRYLAHKIAHLTGLADGRPDKLPAVLAELATTGSEPLARDAPRLALYRTTEARLQSALRRMWDEPTAVQSHEDEPADDRGVGGVGDEAGASGGADEAGASGGAASPAAQPPGTHAALALLAATFTSLREAFCSRAAEDGVAPAGASAPRAAGEGALGWRQWRSSAVCSGHGC